MTNCIDFRAAYATQTTPSDKPLEYNPTPEERDVAAQAQAQLRFDAAVRSLRERGE
jgi:hypothetical protein